MGYVLVATKMGLDPKKDVFEEYYHASATEVVKNANLMLRISEGYYAELYEFVKGEM